MLMKSIISMEINRQFCMDNSDKQLTDTSNEEHAVIQQKVLQEYQVISKIGSGAYGHVWKVKKLKTGTIHAIKKVFLAFQNSIDAQRIYREISILTQLKHKNIVGLDEVILSQGADDIYLVFENMESDLFRAIKNRVLDQMHKKYIVYQLALTLDYLHSCGIVHRDIKPSNILLNSDCKIKICDFGLARTLKSKIFPYNNPIMTEFMATRWYRSPEVLFGSKQYGTKSDMWSLGCLIYQLYSRRTLMAGQSSIDQIVKVLEFKGKPSQEEINSFKAHKASQLISYFNSINRKPLSYYFDDLEDENVKPIILNLLQYDQNRRMSAKQLLKCSFLEQFRNIPQQQVFFKQIFLDLDDNTKLTINRYRQQIQKNVSKNSSNLKVLKRSFNHSSKIIFSSLHVSPTNKNIQPQETSKPHKRNSSLTLHVENNRRKQIVLKTSNKIALKTSNKPRLDISLRPTYRFFINNSSENRNSTSSNLMVSLPKQVLKDKLNRTNDKEVSTARKGQFQSSKHYYAQQNRVKNVKKLKKQPGSNFIGHQC